MKRAVDSTPLSSSDIVWLPTRTSDCPVDRDRIPLKEGVPWIAFEVRIEPCAANRRGLQRKVRDAGPFPYSDRNSRAEILYPLLPRSGIRANCTHIDARTIHGYVCDLHTV